MNERRIWCRLEWLPSIHDKPTRARGFQARAAMGKVLFEPGADVSEYLAFPAGKNDDEVDASSLIGRALDMAHPAIVRIGDKPPRRKDRWDAYSRRARITGHGKRGDLRPLVRRFGSMIMARSGSVR